MALSDETREAAARQVERFCERRSPEDARADMRLEHEARGSKITVVERRAPRNPQSGPDSSRQPIAELRYDAATGTWALYWLRHTGRWHRYEELPAAQDVGPLLAEIDADPDGVFWG
jgi:hypothetical protein